MITNCDIKWNRPQARAYQAIKPQNTVFLGFGRGVGKSLLLRTMCWLLVAQYDGMKREAVKPFRGVRIAWLMPTRKQFSDVHGADILDELEPNGMWGFLGGKVDKTTWQITFPGRSTIMPFPAAEAVSKAARGIRADVLIVDECDDVDAGVYDAVAQPWLSATWSLGMELLAGTPTRGRHGLWYRTLKAGRIGDKIRAGEHPPEIDPADYAAYKTIYSFHATYEDAPETVRPEAVAKARANTPKAIFDREWRANPDSAEGLVFGAVFNEEFHVKEPPPGIVWNEYLIGADHGYEDPGCLLLAGVAGHGKDATLWILDEIYEQHLSDTQWVEKGRPWFAKYPQHKFYPDPSRPGLIRDYEAAGARTKKVDNGILDGISSVADKLFIRQYEDGTEYAHMFVSPKCVNLIREFGLYRRKKRADGSFEDEPVDKNNHAIDSARYLCMSRFGLPQSLRAERSAQQYADG